MNGLMQHRPLTIAHLFDRAELLAATKHVTTAGEGRVTVGEWAGNVRRLASALDALDVPEGARVGTFASNHRRHLELYAAVPITKRVLHTVNIRLSTGHLEHVIGHAADDVLFVDRGLLPSVWELAERLPSVRHWIVMPDGTDHPLPSDPRVLHYDALLDGSTPVPGSFEERFEAADENLAAGLCYTSGTTGLPKGVVYSHRSTILHCLMSLAAGLLGIEERDVVMPIVPMFHANAWGLPYAALMARASLVLPGPSADPLHLLRLMEAEHVTMAAAVPTVWADLLPHLRDFDLGSVRMLLGGGAAVSPSLSEAYRSRIGVPLTHSWGMTEVSPVGAVGGLRSSHDRLDAEAQVGVRAAQGQPVPLVDLRIVDVDSGAEQPWNGLTIGELQVAGPWVASGYLHEDSPESFTPDGWLRTGDLATIDGEGYLRLVDRIKDLIKSGGEWISSVELESVIGSHPDVVEVAVVARPHPRWGERPVAYVVLREGAEVIAADLVAHIAPRLAKWWLPDEFVFVPSIPKTGTGKLSKATLRDSLRSL